MDILKFLQSAQVPAILIIGGLVFLFIAIGGRIKGTIITDKIKPRYAFIIGIVLLLSGFVIAIPVSTPAPEQPTETPTLPSPTVSPTLPAAPILLPTTTTGSFTQAAVLPTSTPLPVNMQLTKAAWDYFNGGLYTEAISKTQECIALFKDQALREQQKLTASSIAAPPVGLVSDEKTKTEILTRGILNDVAACYYVMGQTLEKLERIDEAKEAYQHVQEFPDARVLGQDGYFWSPAQTASDRLTELP